MFGVCRVYLVSEAAQVELKGGRVQAPATRVEHRHERGEQRGLHLGLTLVHFSAQRKHILWDKLGA